MRGDASGSPGSDQTPAGTEVDFDALYAGDEPIWSGEPNGALVDEIAEAEPGRALDVGCGEGADAVWLAQRGWQVTALDIAAAALERAEQHARRAGVQVRWLHRGLLEAPLERESFDLVSAQYPALRHSADDAAIHALLNLVAPGGTLLVVHHADIDVDEARAHGVDPSLYVSPEDVRSALDENWVVVVSERRPRTIRGGAGAHHTHDLVLRAERLT
jgi:SAM-dependent methyltransferase